MATLTQTLTSLVINRLPLRKYHELKESGGLNPDEVYVITDDTLDAVNCTVKNVADPEQRTDAANKAYVDDNTVSAFVFKDKTYYKSSVDLQQMYDLMFDIAKTHGAKVLDAEV